MTLLNNTESEFEILPKPVKSESDQKEYRYSWLKLQKTTCHLQQHFFHISEPNKGTKGPENHS
jgi:hypothetical protein